MADQWYWAFGLGDGDFTGGPTTSGWAPQTYCYGAPVTLGAGTATKLAVRCDAPGATPTLKLGLYDSSFNLVAQGTVGNGEAVAWREATISAAVGAGTYYVLVSSQNAYSRYYYNTSNTGKYASVAYASAMAASVTLGDEANLGYAVKVYVETGGGGVTISVSETLTMAEALD